MTQDLKTASGVPHWRRQRLSAAALALAALWCVTALPPLLQDLSYQGWLAWLHNPINAAATALTLAVAFLHLKLGLETILCDYLPASSQPTAQKAVAFACFAGGASGLLALAILLLAP